MGRAAGDEVGEEFPDGVAGGRAARQEVINLDYFMDRMIVLIYKVGMKLLIRLEINQP